MKPLSVLFVIEALMPQPSGVPARLRSSTCHKKPRS
jgi:hypothetical protein